jgi:hypothetical protein
MRKRLKTALPFVPALAIIGIVLPGARTQTQKAPVAREESMPLIQSVKGPDLSSRGGSGLGKCEIGESG